MSGTSFVKLHRGLTKVSAHASVGKAAAWDSAGLVETDKFDEFHTRKAGNRERILMELLLRTHANEEKPEKYYTNLKVHVRCDFFYLIKQTKT